MHFQKSISCWIDQDISPQPCPIDGCARSAPTPFEATAKNFYRQLKLYCEMVRCLRAPKKQDMPVQNSYFRSLLKRK
jgi:hypothetical protein